VEEKMARKRKLPPMALRQTDDSDRMLAAIDCGLATGLATLRLTNFHLKIGVFNVFPDSGKFYRDGGVPGSELGLRSLREAIANWKEEEYAKFL
jgi:hypothetical protein